MLRALSPGQSIATVAGRGYGFDAKVKTSHTKADVFQLAASKGLRIASYGEGPTEGSYRRVVVIALATAPASLPWSLPSPLSWFDDSQIVEATEETDPSAAQLALAQATSPTPAAAVPTAAVPARPATAARAHVWPALGLGAALLVVADVVTGEGPLGRIVRRRRRRR